MGLKNYCDQNALQTFKIVFLYPIIIALVSIIIIIICNTIFPENISILISLILIFVQPFLYIYLTYSELQHISKSCKKIIVEE